MTDNTSYVNKVIAMNIRHIMAARALSNKDVVDLTGISPATVSKILNHQLKVTSDKLMDFCRGLQVPVTTLLEGLDYVDAVPEKQKQVKLPTFSVGILSINDRRICMVDKESGGQIGSSEVTGNLSLADSYPDFLRKLKESISLSLGDTTQGPDSFKNINLSIVTQCYEFEKTRQKFQESLSRVFRKVRILSDWQLTYKAAFDKQSGISLVVDKGVSLSYMMDGQLQKLGGWGFPIYDMGGEYWLGMMALRHTIQAEEGFAQKSLLSSSVLVEYSGRLEFLVEKNLKNIKDFEKYIKFSDLLLHSYHANDKMAAAIVKEGYAEISKMIAKVDTLFGKEVKISISGSLADLYRPFIDGNRLLRKITDTDKTGLLVCLNYWVR